MQPDTFVVSHFRAELQDSVKTLVLAGLEERWGSPLDCSKNQDLDNIPLSFGNAVFLVCHVGDKLIGCGALIPCKGDAAAGEIVRMSVSKDWRRMGVGKLILQKLI